MADVYRETVSSLCNASEHEDGRAGAADDIRGLIEAILLEPDGGQLKITLKGNLAGMLSAARDSKRSPETGDLMLQIKLVAGARCRRCRRPCTSLLRRRTAPFHHAALPLD
jgi:site-specific DNA recombinase